MEQENCRHPCLKQSHVCPYKIKSKLLPLSLLSTIAFVTCKGGIFANDHVKSVLPKIPSDHCIFFSRLFRGVVKNQTAELPAIVNLNLMIRACLELSYEIGVDKVRNIIECYIEFIDVNWVVGHLVNVLEIQPSILLYVVQKITDYIVLNNVLILSGFYGNAEIMNVCLDMGATEHQMCVRAAALAHKEQFVHESVFYSTSWEITESFKQTAQFAIYRNAKASYSNHCNRSMTDQVAKLGVFLGRGKSARCVGLDNIYCLMTPVYYWPACSMFRVICSLPEHIILSEALTYQARFKSIVNHVLEGTDDCLPDDDIDDYDNYDGCSNNDDDDDDDDDDEALVV